MKTEETIRQTLDEELNWLTFQGQETVLEQLHQPVRRLPKRRMVVVLAVLLMLLCATAVALVLHFTPAYSAERSARDAVAAKYGLTSDMLDLFYAQTAQTADGWQVTLTSASLDIARIGVYEVTLPTSGQANVTWSHDGTDLLDGSLSAEAWGPAQLEKVMAARQQNSENWSGNIYTHYDTLTLEDKAALDAGLMLEDETASGLVHIAPGSDDLTSEQAEVIARQALHNKYGIDEDSVQRQSINFFYYDADYAESRFKLHTALRAYRFDFLTGKRDGSFVVQVASPDGEVLYCVKQVEPEDDFLPEGDLSAYPDAVRAWVDNNAFAFLTADEKAEAARRFAEAGLRNLLPEGEFLPSSSVRVSEAEAVTTAKQALNEHYQLTDERLAPFALVAALTRQDGTAVWKLTWNWNELWRAVDHPHLPMERLGSYTVTVSSENRGVVSCAWTMDGETQTDLLGTSQAWGAALIDRLYTLQDAYVAIMQPYRETEPDAAWNIGEMSFTDDAAACAMMTAEGFSQREYSYVLPEASDLTHDQAVTMARQAVAEVYSGVDVQSLPLLDMMTDCMMRYEEGQAPTRVWCVTFDDGLERYTVELDASTGITRGIWHDTASSGNG